MTIKQPEWGQWHRSDVDAAWRDEDGWWGKRQHVPVLPHSSSFFLSPQSAWHKPDEDDSQLLHIFVFFLISGIHVWHTHFFVKQTSFQISVLVCVCLCVWAVITSEVWRGQAPMMDDQRLCVCMFNSLITQQPSASEVPLMTETSPRLYVSSVLHIKYEDRNVFACCRVTSSVLHTNIHLIVFICASYG